MRLFSECVITDYEYRLEVFRAVTMKKGVFYDVTPRGSFEKRRFGEI
jgi:hypothetical protein